MVILTQTIIAIPQKEILHSTTSVLGTLWVVHPKNVKLYDLSITYSEPPLKGLWDLVT